MSLRLLATLVATLVFAGGLMAAACGGGDSPTQPVTPTPPAPPAPPPAPTVSVVEVSPNMATLEVGKTQRFVATAKASDGTVISGVNFTWSSSNTAVVTINSGGVATAVSAGTATIRATGNGVASASVTITVTVAPVARVTIDPSSIQELMVGEMVTFSATARTAGGAVRSGVSFIWASSDSSVVTITSAGVATAVAAGTAMVRATADGIASSPVTINVAKPPPPEPVVASVTVSPSEATIEEGATQQFAAMASTSDGMEIPDVEFTWSSSNVLVAMIDSDGLANGVGAGEAMITATADGISGMATLTVTEPPPSEPMIATVTVTPPEAMIEEGETQQFTAMASTSDGMEIPDVEFTWSSSNVLVAMIDSDGLANGVGAGEAMITATADGISGMATLTVTETPETPDPPDPPDPPETPDPPDPPDPPPPPPEPTVASVSVSPSEATVKEGETKQFSATAYDSDNMEISGKTFTWRSSDPLKATVNSSGLATGRDAGSVTITAATDGESGDATLTIEALSSRTGTISGRNNYSSGGSVTLSETSDGKLKLSITGLSTPGGAPDVFVALYTNSDIHWPNGGSLPDGAREFGEVTGQSGSKSWTFTPDAGESIDSWSHLILHCRLINSEVGSASLSN